MRIQLRRTAGWRKPEGAIVVARPSKWGNPYKVGGTFQHDGVQSTVRDRAHAVVLYRNWLDGQLHIADVVAELSGHDLACWCPLVDETGSPVPCHADVLLALANSETALEQ
jgi:hypothetical protein